jgi:hypothetical protein
MDKTQKIEKCRRLLPLRVVVCVMNTDEGLWAKISTTDGTLTHCYTQAANTVELVTMINDAVFTHFEVPEELRSDVGYYVPLSDNHTRMEQMFNQLVSMEKELDSGHNSETTLTLSEAVC